MQTVENKQRPKLSSKEQIEHLKKKGVKFLISSEEDAEKYLIENNNYFKLRAYRKSFEKHTDGEKADTYVNLDFEMLKDLAIIDMRMRYALLPLALDIEHFEKVKLLKIIAESDDDGYNVVKKYIDNLKNVENSSATYKPYSTLISEIERNKSNEYCGGIINKYNGRYPVWAFTEIIPFGRFLNFLYFCSDYLEDKNLKDDWFLLRDVKRLRNAAAHNNCILHNLSLNTSQHKTNFAVSCYLGNKLAVSKDIRNRRMSNATIRDIVTLLYAHKRIVLSPGVQKAQAEKLHEVIIRCFKHIDYYKDNDLIITTFDFLKKVVDKTHPL